MNQATRDLLDGYAELLKLAPKGSLPSVADWSQMSHPEQAAVIEKAACRDDASDLCLAWALNITMTVLALQKVKDAWARVRALEATASQLELKESR